VDLYSDKGAKPYFTKVHRLVALQFLPNPENLPCVNHKDSIRHNNSVDNLEWCTHKENSEHMVRQGRTSSYSKKHMVDEVQKLRNEGMSIIGITRILDIGRTALTNWKREGLIS